MIRLLLSLSTMLAAACAPTPQKVAMPSPSPASGVTADRSNASNPQGDAAIAATPAPVASGPQTDSPAAALGRRILSTAFVRVGPDGHLTVTLHGGGTLVLRDVVMRPADYCGVQVAGDPGRTKYCGQYAEVAAARPGGAPAPDQPDPAIVNPVGLARDPAKAK